MGLLSQLRALRNKKDEARILVLGLDNAGKTTILRALSNEETTSVMPTKGFNIKSLSQDGLKLNMWDIGGQREIRPYWRNYYDNTDALIYVVDSADEGRMTELKENLQELLTEEQLSGVPLLVFANKQDLDLALGADEVMESLELSNITDRTWNIQACSAHNGEGLQEGCDWLIQNAVAKNKAQAE